MKLYIKYLVTIFVFFIAAKGSVNGQFSTNDDSGSDIIFKPTISFGTGMFTYYGDISRNQKTNSAIISRVGYDLRVTQQLTPFLDGSFYILFGKLGANERSDVRNLNFESKISLGGINLSYNFNHFLKPDRIVEPYVSLGIESFEFLSKTDLRDQYGNTYYYWSDGSIRNIDENDVDKKNAIRLQRDYKYESDIRNMNVDSFGKYPERSFAIPVGAGVNLLLTDKLSFRMGTTLHFTLTDYIDGVTEKSIGNRKGDAKNDRFLFTSISLSYNIGGREPAEEENFDGLTNEQYLAMLNDDSDGDGVTDFKDNCPGTLAGIPVDTLGCPLDGDGDGVPDNIDEEPNTAFGSIVDEKGVALNDSLLALRAKPFTDSLYGGNMEIVKTEHVGERSTAVKQQYTVRLAEFSGPIPQDVAEMLLNIPDVNSWEENGNTFITVGNYDNLPDAVKRKLQEAEAGFKDATVAQKNGDKNITPITDDGTIIGDLSKDPPGQIIYRVQVGAFSKKLSKNIFDGIPQLLILSFDDGLTRYFSGSFTDYKEAAKRKVDILVEGFEGAFVVAFKDGKRIGLGETGAITPVKDKPVVTKGGNVKDNVSGSNDKTASGNNTGNESSGGKSAVKKDYIKFMVQVGVFKGDVPTDILEKYMKLGNVTQEKTSEGLVKYVSGSFSNYQDAVNHKNKLSEQGFSGAFIIGKFKDKFVTAQEAIELLKIQE